MSAENVIKDAENEIKTAILETLLNLGADNYEEFCSELLNGDPPIFKTEVEKKSRTAVRDLLWTRCSHGALDRTLKTLLNIRCLNAAEKLKSRCKPAMAVLRSSSESEPGPAPRPHSHEGSAAVPKIQKRKFCSPPSETRSARVQNNNADTQEDLSADGGRISLPRQPTFAKGDEADAPKKRKPEDEVYQVNSNPRGICFILNNVNFPKGRRDGSDIDAGNLAEVFSRLGFTVLMCVDQTQRQMFHVLQLFSTLTDVSELLQFGLQMWTDADGFVELQQIPPLKHGDVFVCCVLSHGDKGVVFGTDENPLSIKTITRTFSASRDSPLSGKPKVFLIQACQGRYIHRAAIEEDLDNDNISVRTFPEEADVLVAVSSVEDYVSRRPNTGSWFIQSFCPELKEGCERGDDIHTILQRVNREVAKKEHISQDYGLIKQMPEVRYTLRKTLRLPPPLNN